MKIFFFQTVYVNFSDCLSFNYDDFITKFSRGSGIELTVNDPLLIAHVIDAQ